MVVAVVYGIYMRGAVINLKEFLPGRLGRRMSITTMKVFKQTVRPDTDAFPRNKASMKDMCNLLMKWNYDGKSHGPGDGMLSKGAGLPNDIIRFLVAPYLKDVPRDMNYYNKPLRHDIGWRIITTNGRKRHCHTLDLPNRWSEGVCKDFLATHPHQWEEGVPLGKMPKGKKIEDFDFNWAKMPVFLRNSVFMGNKNGWMSITQKAEYDKKRLEKKMTVPMKAEADYDDYHPI
jgi:hypothetical protein